MNTNKCDVVNIKDFSASINISVNDLALLATQRMYFHTYCIWQAYKQIKNSDPTLLYTKFWEKDAQKSFAAVVKALNIKTVPNIKVLGEIVAYATSCAPSLYITRVSEEDFHVGYVTWCGNPGVLKLPNKTRFCADDYIRAECRIEIAYLYTYVAEARKMGLKDEVEIQSNNPRCGTCFSSACQFVLAKKGLKNRVIPEEEFEFIDSKIDPDKPLDYVLKELNRSFDEQALMSVSSFFAKDLSAWEVLWDLDPEKTLDYYQLIWDGYVETNINEFKLNLSLAYRKSIEEIAEALLLFGLQNMLIPCSLEKREKNRSVYSIDLCQFVRSSSKCKQQDKYLNDVVQMLQNYIAQLFSLSGLSGIKLIEAATKFDNQELSITVEC